MESTYDYGIWPMVVLNILLFGAFIFGFMRPKGEHEWKNLGVFLAFIVALFAEMYGFPLTIYLLTSVFGTQLLGPDQFSHINGHLLGALFGFPVWANLIICQIGAIVMLIGGIIIAKAWQLIHEAHGALVTGKIYARMRHPQYTGMFLVTLGMLIQWPTLLTLIMWPILMLAYYRLALREESQMLMEFGTDYTEYRQRVPAFIPRFTIHNQKENSHV